MAGGMILIGILLAIMPVAAAMVLHGATQMAFNGWRAWPWRTQIRSIKPDVNQLTPANGAPVP